MTRTAAGTTMTATAIAGHNKHGTTSTASISICLSTQLLRQKKDDERQVLLLYTDRKASANQPQTDPG
jgi:hypothetical protein